MSEPTPPAAHAEPAKTKSPINKAMIGIVGVNLLMSGALAAFILTRPPPAAAPPTHTEGKGKDEGEAKGEGHGEEKKAEGGHGEEKKAEGHGEEKKAEGHGEEKKEEGGHGGGEKKEVPAEVGSTARLEDIIVHLRNPEIDRYARLTLDVEMSNQSELTQLQPRTPQIRDAVITALSEETFESLRGSEGLANMKAKLRDRIDAVVPGTVRAVYVSGFIVQ